MLAPMMQGAPADLDDRLRDAPVATAALLHEVIEKACHRFPPAVPTARTARIERLIAMKAWTEAALALVELELPQWQVRRIIYDGGEWHCALSRERELPDWLDQAVEGRHADLTLALLCAFVEAQAAGSSRSQPSVPTVGYRLNPLYDPVCCDNFA